MKMKVKVVLEIEVDSVVTPPSKRGVGFDVYRTIKETRCLPVGSTVLTCQTERLVKKPRKRKAIAVSSPPSPVLAGGVPSLACGPECTEPHED